MKYKVGDAVKVKSLTEIKKTLDKNGMSKNEILYSRDMSNCCGCTHYIKRVEEKGYRLDGVYWLWAEEWLEPPIPPTPKPTKFGLDYKIKVDFIEGDKILEEWLNFKDTKNYENQLQRKKTRVRGADIPEGSRIRSRKCKAAIVVGHLSNQARAGY